MNELNTINIKSLKTPLDNSTNSIIRFRRGDDVSFRVAIFKDETTLATLDSINSLRFEIYDIGNYQSPSPRTFSIILQKIVDVENINTNLALEDWESGESQHCIFEISALESTLEYGEKWLKISAELSDSKKVTISAGWIEIEENDSNYENLNENEIQEWTNSAKAAAQSAIETKESTQEIFNETQEIFNETQEYFTTNSESLTASINTLTNSAITEIENAKDESLEEILGKSVTNTTSSSINVAIASNTIYSYGTLSSLTLSSVENSIYESRIFFKSGTTATSFTYPSTLNTIGEIGIASNSSYAISICNNIMIIGALN